MSFDLSGLHRRDAYGIMVGATSQDGLPGKISVLPAGEQTRFPWRIGHYFWGQDFITYELYKAWLTMTFQLIFSDYLAAWVSERLFQTISGYNNLVCDQIVCEMDKIRIEGDRSTKVRLRQCSACLETLNCSVECKKRRPRSGRQFQGKTICCNTSSLDHVVFVECRFFLSHITCSASWVDRFLSCQF